MYRTIDCATWDDPWFADLTPPTKLLFLYLVTNRRATACGAFEITARAMAFETGLTAEELTTALAALAPKVIWWPDLQVIWVRNFYRWQRANSNASFATAAQKALAKLPACVQSAIQVAYPELATGDMSHPPATPLPPPSDGGKETVTVTETVTEYTPLPPTAPPAPEPDAFEAIPRTLDVRAERSKRAALAAAAARPIRCPTWEQLPRAFRSELTTLIAPHPAVSEDQIRRQIGWFYDKAGREVRTLDEWQTELRALVQNEIDKWRPTAVLRAAGPGPARAVRSAADYLREH